MTTQHPTAAGALSSQTALLQALASGRWRTRVELADETGLVPAAAAQLLRELSRLKLVCASQTWRRPGQWQITATGLEHVHRVHGEGALR